MTPNDIPEFVSMEIPLDYENYVYAVCECHNMNEAIRIKRRDVTTFISFKCPRCGKELVVLAVGKSDWY